MLELHNNFRLFDEIRSDLAEFDVLLSRLGIKRSGSDWVEKSLREVNEYENSRDAGTLIEYVAAHSDFDHKITQLGDLCSIARHLKDQDPTIMAEKLRLILKGADTSLVESEASTKARDTLFELRLCTYLKEGGIAAKLCKPNPDILIEDSGVPHWIECKRLHSQTPKRFETDMKAAYRQLRDNKPALATGVIALDVSRLFTIPKDSQLSESNLDQYVKGRIENFFVGIGREAQRVLEKRKMFCVAGVVLSFTGVATTEKLNWMHLNRITPNPLNPKGFEQVRKILDSWAD